MDKDKRNQIKQEIEEFLPILEKNNNNERQNEALLYNVDTENGTIVKILLISENEKLLAPVISILSDKNIRGLFSENYVRQKIMKLYHKILSDSSKKESLIDELLNSLAKEKGDEYFVCMGLENVKIVDNIDYEFIDSTIKIMKEEDLPKFDKKIIKGLYCEMIDKPCIVTEVTAGDEEKAQEKALDHFFVSISLIKLYLPNVDIFLKGHHETTGKKEAIIFNRTKKELCWDISNDVYSCLRLTKQLYKQIEEAGVDKLKETNSTTKKIKDALYWFGLGLNEKHLSAKMMDFVTVLEITLKRKGEKTEATNKISERGALFLQDYFNCRLESCKLLKKIYNLRGDVTHAGTLTNDKDLVNTAGNYAKAILFRLIRNLDQIGDFDSFITKIDELKFTGKSIFEK